jgi:hypothetical protein
MCSGAKEKRASKPIDSCLELMISSDTKPPSRLIRKKANAVTRVAQRMSAKSSWRPRLLRHTGGLAEVGKRISYFTSMVENGAVARKESPAVDLHL